MAHHRVTGTYALQNAAWPGHMEWPGQAADVQRDRQSAERPSDVVHLSVVKPPIDESGGYSSGSIMVTSPSTGPVMVRSP